jgi:NADH-quinone oxidoreductase subunit C
MERITIDQLNQEIQNHFIDKNIIFTEDHHGVFCCEVPIQQLYKLVNHLFKNEELGFQFLTDLCGIHYPDNPGKELGVVYHLQNMKRGNRMRLKVFVPVTKPEVPTLSGIYASANWMERETYDFYGIQFAGHPNLKRILNMDEMIEFPMRKEFPLEDPTREDKADFHFGR